MASVMEWTKLAYTRSNSWNMAEKRLSHSLAARPRESFHHWSLDFSFGSKKKRKDKKNEKTNKREKAKYTDPQLIQQIRHHNVTG